MIGPGAGAGPFHHYVFEFYALDTKLNLPNTSTRSQVFAAMDGPEQRIASNRDGAIGSRVLGRNTIRNSSSWPTNGSKAIIRVSGLVGTPLIPEHRYVPVKHKEAA